jgi:hypothetical protein
VLTLLRYVCRWLDGSLPPSTSTYIHWGTTVPDGTKEPDNANPKRNEFCAVANVTQMFDSPPAWGWADTQCSQKLPYMCKKQASGSAYMFVSPSSRTTYVLNTTALNFVDAQYTCNEQGGHLVYYNTLDEQQEVEQYYVSNGYFINSFHKFYWIGYRTLNWPFFVWVNNDSRSDSAQANYTHWGTYYVSACAWLVMSCTCCCGCLWRPGCCSLGAASSHHGPTLAVAFLRTPIAA